MTDAGNYFAQNPRIGHSSRRRALSTWIPAVCLAGIAIAVAVVFLRAHTSHDEALATRVVASIVAGNMDSVAADFSPSVRPKLQDRATVGKLSRDLNALGALKRLREDTPEGAPPRFHRFNAYFERITWSADMVYDDSGKIFAFFVHPLDVNTH